MNVDSRSIVLAVLHEIAPEVDIGVLPGDASFRDDLGLDSMDVLNFVTVLHERTGLDVPERDYASMDSIDGCVAYLSAHRIP